MEPATPSRTTNLRFGASKKTVLLEDYYFVAGGI